VSKFAHWPRSVRPKDTVPVRQLAERGAAAICYPANPKSYPPSPRYQTAPQSRQHSWGATPTGHQGLCEKRPLFSSQGQSGRILQGFRGCGNRRLIACIKRRIAVRKHFYDELATVERGAFRVIDVRSCVGDEHVGGSSSRPLQRAGACR
jgi:hypothetical protein